MLFKVKKGFSKFVNNYQDKTDPMLWYKVLLFIVGSLIIILTIIGGLY